MANKEHVAILERGADAWNDWREENPGIKPELSEANLNVGTLLGVNLAEANLTKANLDLADLREADLSGADLSGTLLSETNLGAATLRGTNLSRVEGSFVILNHADLTGAKLRGAHLSAINLTNATLDLADLRDVDLSTIILHGARLRGADLTGARLFDIAFSNTNLTNAKGLDTCIHFGPSSIDYRTLQQSGPLPLAFLRGVGLPDNLIDYLPSLLNQPIQFFSCFISYSSKDQKFADRLHADLQNKGVRCWFAPHDLPIGAKTWDAIDEAIRLRDKVLLILSRNSIGSDWVEDEVTKAFAEERTRKQLVLFPIRLDDAVIETTEAWAGKLRDNRNIGDFRRWKNHDAYEKALERVLRDLKMAPVER